MKKPHEWHGPLPREIPNTAVDIKVRRTRTYGKRLRGDVITESRKPGPARLRVQLSMTMPSGLGYALCPGWIIETSCPVATVHVHRAIADAIAALNNVKLESPEAI